MTAIRLAALAAVSTALLLPAAASAAPPSGLAAHRAVYDLALAEGASDDLVDVSGRLVMEFTGSACAGYTSKLRFVTQTDGGDGDSQITDSRSSTFESADGQVLEFTNETYTDDMLAEASSGKARRGADGVAIDLTKPSAKTAKLPKAIVFPAEQMERILATARRGETFLTLDVYDGSEDGETIYETAGVIGKASTDADDIGAETAVAKAGMAGPRHWPLTISYFDKAEGGDNPPFYVFSFVVYENGVGRTLRIDYGNFALAGTLTGLELLPSAPCP